MYYVIYSDKENYLRSLYQQITLVINRGDPVLQVLNGKFHIQMLIFIYLWFQKHQAAVRLTMAFTKTKSCFCSPQYFNFLCFSKVPNTLFSFCLPGTLKLAIVLQHEDFYLQICFSSFIIQTLILHAYYKLLRYDIIICI